MDMVIYRSSLITGMLYVMKSILYILTMNIILLAIVIGMLIGLLFLKIEYRLEEQCYKHLITYYNIKEEAL